MSFGGGLACCHRHRFFFWNLKNLNARNLAILLLIAGRLMRKSLIQALLLVGLVALTIVPPFPLAPQAAPQERSPDERRRAERSPIELASGAKVEFSSFTSAALKENREFSIYLPPTYAKGNRNYPVVYFLHGLNNDHTSWTVDRYGHIHEQVDKLIAEKAT